MTEENKVMDSAEDPKRPETRASEKKREETSNCLRVEAMIECRLIIFDQILAD